MHYLPRIGSILLVASAAFGSSFALADQPGSGPKLPAGASGSSPASSYDFLCGGGHGYGGGRHSGGGFVGLAHEVVVEPAS